MCTITISRNELVDFLQQVPKQGGLPKFSWNKDGAWPSKSKDPNYNHPTLCKIFKHLRDTYYRQDGTTPKFIITEHCVQKVAYDKAVMAVFEFI